MLDESSEVVDLRARAERETERIFQAEEQLLRAQLVASQSESECNNAEANWLAQQCHVLRLETAKMSQ